MPGHSIFKRDTRSKTHSPCIHLRFCIPCRLEHSLLQSVWGHSEKSNVGYSSTKMQQMRYANALIRPNLPFNQDPIATIFQPPPCVPLSCPLRSSHQLLVNFLRYAPIPCQAGSESKMENLPKHLKEKYARDRALLPDDSDLPPGIVTYSDTLKGYYFLIDYFENLTTGEKMGSSRNTGEGSSDLEKEVGVVAEAIGHALDDLDAVVDPL